MEIPEHLALLRSDGGRLADVAAATSLDAAVPGCPGWNLDGLLRHVGDVHRWAAKVVRERAPQRIRADFAGPPRGDQLIAWYRDGLDQLLTVLHAASPSDRFWAWGEAPSPLAFWARRQAHETAIHRLDAEQAAGLPATFSPAAGADGLDEWLMLASRSYPTRVPDGAGRVLGVRALDMPAEWFITLNPDGLLVEPTAATVDCAVRAGSGDLFTLLMNRRDEGGLEVSGDGDVLSCWRRSVHF